MVSRRAKSTVIFTHATAWSAAVCIPREMRKEARTTKRAARLSTGASYFWGSNAANACSTS